MSVQVEQSKLKNSKDLFRKLEMLQRMLGNLLSAISKNSRKITVACDGEIIHLEESMLLDVYRAIPEKHRKRYLKIGDFILDP
jgi:hypothetical protein